MGKCMAVESRLTNIRVAQAFRAMKLRCLNVEPSHKLTFGIKTEKVGWIRIYCADHAYDRSAIDITVTPSRGSCMIDRFRRTTPFDSMAYDGGKWKLISCIRTTSPWARS